MTVVIPTYNGAAALGAVLDALRAQRVEGGLELLVIDSGSTDGTPELAAARGARVERISQKEFFHGGTRNRGARAAAGRVVVFLSQDVEPESPDTLATLVAPLARPGVVASFARQVARPDAYPMERFFLDRIYPPTPRTFTAVDLPRLPPGTILFSNAASAVRKEALLAHPFHETIIMSEDVEWSYRRVAAGDAIVYEPRARVLHSHRYTLKWMFKRNFDSAYSLRGIFHYTFADVLRIGFAHLRDEISTLWGSGNARWIPYAILHEAVRFLGLSLGKRAFWLPRRVCRALSSNWKYWDQTDPELRARALPRAEGQACPMCGSGRLEPAFVLGDVYLQSTPREFSVHRCRACGGGVTLPFLTAEELPGVYPREYWLDAPASLRERLEDVYRTGCVLDRVQAVLRELARCGRPRAGSVLDVGCSDGVLLAAVRRRGHRVLGVDVSRAAAERARARGVEVRLGDLDALPADQRFDVVTLFHTLEHVADPVGLLRKIAARLAPGGALIVEVPDWTSFEARLLGHRWMGLEIPRHQVHFGPRALRIALERAGFRVERMRHFSLQVSPAVLAHSFRPDLDPVYRRARGVPVTLASELAHLAITVGCLLPTALEAWAGTGGAVGATARVKE